MREHGNGHQDRDHECIDPALGSELWRRHDPDCPAELRARLDAHLAYCAACRLTVAVEAGVAAGLRDRTLHVEQASGAHRVSRWAGGSGAGLLAAGLALLLLLPPRAPHEGLVLRGDDGPAIVRPVPDEVVLGGRPAFRWTPLAGANRYDLQVTMVDGTAAWSTTTDQAEAAVPAGMDLPRDARFRVSVQPVPAHVAPGGALRSSFRTGGLRAWLGYRARQGSPVGRVVVFGGLLGLAVAGVGAILEARGGGRRGAG
jgi:hypothetical protein